MSIEVSSMITALALVSVQRRGTLQYTHHTNVLVLVILVCFYFDVYVRQTELFSVSCEMHVRILSQSRKPSQRLFVKTRYYPKIPNTSPRGVYSSSSLLLSSLLLL